ncbi:MAG TPA: hypothetical protein VNL15_06580, partial [Dehalococcoidia bacterium]|nr:hypothetical protein [Dehalococcoidia bacterium]
LLAPGWHFAVEQVRRRGLPPMTDTQRDAYLTQQLGQTYLAYKFLNELKGQHYTVYALNDEGLVYFADGTHIGDCLGPARYSLVMIRLPDADGTPPPGECDPNRYKRSSYNKLVDGRTLYDRLKALGTDYFLVNQLFERVELPDDDFFHSHFKLIYARSKVLLFELTTEPWEYKPGPELLQNASFEALDQGQPIGWGRAGSPLIEGSGQHSHSGAVAVRSDGPENVLYQAVPVKPNRSYRLSFYARAESKGQQTRLQVNWADAQGKFLATNIEVAAVGLDWRRYELYVQVPERAAFAEIYASPHEGSSVWYDDFSFIEITYSPPGPAVQRKLGPELLVNPGFEILVGGEHPAAWRRVGTPTVDASGQHSHTGKVAVHAVGAPTVTAPAGPAAVRSLNVDNLLYQLVGVRPGATYTLRLYARADAPDQQVRLHITWVDIQGSLLATSTQLAEVGPDWQQYELEGEAPPGAAYALIATSPQTGNAVWFDDFSFVEVTYEPKPPGP